MRLVIAPDKFKGCLSAAQVAEAIAAGVRGAVPDAQIDLCPVADGGEGTVAALVAATGGQIHERTVTGPLPGTKVEAAFGMLGDGRTAVVEMAAASGLHLLRPEQRNPMRTTTYGTGELLRTAADLGARTIILGIGGSATCDGGLGAAQAWGAQIELTNGSVYTATDRKITGSDLANVLRVDSDVRREKAPRDSTFGAVPSQLPFGAAPVDLHDRVLRLPSPATQSHRRHERPPRKVEFIVACDVSNPLCGPNGAARVFGPQKGASPQQVEDLDRALHQLAARCGASDLANVPGAGAAGGLGFGMLTFFGATLRSGIEIVTEATRLRQRLAGIDLCITGEGRLDSQSLAGKATIGVAQLCKQLNIPCIALCGSLDGDIDAAREHGLCAWFSICDRPMTTDQAISHASELLARSAANIMRTMCIPRKCGG